MKTYHKLYKTLFILLLCNFGLQAQPLFKQFLNNAENEFEKGNYSRVLELASQAVDIEKPNETTAYMYAESARLQYAYKLADTYYTYLLDTLKSTKYDDAYYKLADVKHTMGKYEDAQKYYALYLSEVGGDDEKMTAKVEMLNSSVTWAIAQEKEEKKLKEVEQMANGVNTPYSEHGAYHDGDNFYFTSLKFPKDNDTYEPHRLVSKVLSDTKGNTFMSLDESNNFNNGNLLTSGTSISPDKQLMFCSICEYASESVTNCAIYYLKNEDGQWKNPIKLPEQVNQLGANATHPAIGEMDENEKTRLYFVSDRSGGKGQRDIYSVLFDKQMEFSTSIPLSDVNTEYDDITPFFSHNTFELYFSSNGRDGFGNYDVYKRSFDGDISNLGYGINTSYNDIFYSISADEENQYVSSNRIGSMHLDSKFETCCYDIYNLKFEKCTVDLLALSYDDNTKEELTGVSLYLKNITTGVEEEIKINELGNDFEYEIICNHEYEIIAKKEGFNDARITISKEETKFIAGNEAKLEKKLYLMPMVLPVKLIVNTYERPTNYDLLDATVTLIDTETGEEVAVISKNPKNIFEFDALQGRSYKIIATRDGYDQEIAMFTVPLDQKGAYRKDLYLGREAVIETLANLIPLRLYYDNDYPNPRSREITTDESYQNTYFKYASKKPEFVSKYAGLFKGVEYELASFEMDNFFEKEVRHGHDKLSIFLETLNRILLTGKKVHLYLRGYASPLSKSEYNEALGRRRVDCVRNEFMAYENGILMKYLNSKQLEITERSFGEAEADKSISDDPRSPQRSIFSPSASRERRVEIDEIKEVK